MVFVWWEDTWLSPAPLLLEEFSIWGRFIGAGKETSTAGGSLGVRFAHTIRGLRALGAGTAPLLFSPGTL